MAWVVGVSREVEAFGVKHRAADAVDKGCVSRVSRAAKTRGSRLFFLLSFISTFFNLFTNLKPCCVVVVFSFAFYNYCSLETRGCAHTAQFGSQGRKVDSQPPQFMA